METKLVLTVRDKLQVWKGRGIKKQLKSEPCGAGLELHNRNTQMLLDLQWIYIWTNPLFKSKVS